jgi:hypothetical protein
MLAERFPLIEDMNEDVNELLNRHPAAVLLWLEDWLKHGKSISHDSEINWLGLGDSAAAYACNTYGRHTTVESILWGSIAVTVREHLAKSESDRPGVLYPAMIVRCNLILAFGNHPGDPLCDSKIVRDWFFQAIPLNLEGAEIETRNWHRKPEERKFEMKWVIDWLEMLRSLATAGKLQIDPDLQPWFDLLKEIRPEMNLMAGE